MSLIGRFEHLPKRPKSDEARPLLEKIASQVKPIMTKRSWKVGTLAEFLPSDPSLLGNNMNRGQRINLRLRPPGATDTFYDYEQLVLVMLHELTHNQFGPHDASFYKLLAELEEEYYELKRKGFSGEGFHSDGNRVTGIKRDEYAGRLTGLQAAERRLAAQRKIGKGGVLGGRGTTAGKTIREVLAEAAERRIRDDKACAAGGSKDVEEEVRKAAEESVGIDAVDLTGSGDDEPGPSSRRGSGSGSSSGAGVGTKRPEVDGAEDVERAVRVKTEQAGPSSDGRSPIFPNPSPTKSEPSTPPVIAKAPKPPIISPTRPTPTTSTKPAKSPNRPKQPPQPSEWSCPTCTLLNPIHHLSCDACATERPAGLIRADPAGPTGGNGVFGVDGKGAGLGIAEGWFCGTCGEGPTSWERWSCEGCGVVRSFG